MEKTEPTWHFSTQGLPVLLITETDRRLLPCIFTLTCLPGGKAGSYFLWHYLFPAFTCVGPGYSPVRCPILSGLSSDPHKADPR